MTFGLTTAAASFLGVSCSKQGESNRATWDSGDLQHILASVSHRSMNIKISFKSDLEKIPYLEVNGKKFPGEQQDTLGRFWAFRVTNLSPESEYQLQVLNHDKQPICDRWPSPLS